MSSNLVSSLTLLLAEFKVRTQLTSKKLYKHIISNSIHLMKTVNENMTPEEETPTGEKERKEKSAYDQEREEKLKLLEQQVEYLKSQMLLITQAQVSVSRSPKKSPKKSNSVATLSDEQDFVPGEISQSVGPIGPICINSSGPPIILSSINGPSIPSGPPVSIMNGPPISCMIPPPINTSNNLKSCLKSSSPISEEKEVKESANTHISADDLMRAAARLKSKEPVPMQDLVLPNGKKVFSRKLVEEEEKIDFCSEVKLAAKIKLRKTVCFRSPGGTPLRANESKENQDPFKNALLKKFENVSDTPSKKKTNLRESLGRRLEVESKRSLHEVTDHEWTLN